MANKKWLLPTNTENLGVMIAQGLISDQQGFSKYYIDILSERAGYIPIIHENEEKGLLSAALKMATSEDSGLTPCIIEINLKNIECGRIVTENGTLVDIVDIFALNDEPSCPGKILIPAPLPLSCIAKVLFKTIKERDEFIHNTKTIYRNIPLVSLNFEAPKYAKKFFNIAKNPLFSSSDDIFDVPAGTRSNTAPLGPRNIEKNVINYKKTYSLGGLLGSLFYYTKNGNLSADAFRTFCNTNKVNNVKIHDFPLSYDFFYLIESSLTNTNPTNMMYNKLLDIIVNSNKKECKNSIIEWLRSDMLPGGDTFKESANKLADELIAFDRNTIDKTISEIFSDSQTPKDKTSIKLVLLMLFHREDVKALTDFDLEILKEEDYILFAMLFGIRDKFIGLPKFLREYDGLQEYISNLMAQYAHDVAQTGITFKKGKAPLTLIDMLKPNKLEFILQTSKQLNIEDCFISVMPRVDFSNSNGISTYPGIVLPKIQKDEDMFFAKMAATPIDNNLYNKILQKYKKL
jgi:hypothetical protein